MCGCELLTQFFLTPLKVVTTPLNPTQHPLRTLERFESLNLTYNGGGWHSSGIEAKFALPVTSTVLKINL